MKVLVTGANGYIGQGVVKALLKKKIEVVAADISCEYVDEKAERFSCNLFEIENPYEYFQYPDVLLHLAWRKGFEHYADEHIMDLPLHYQFIKSFAESKINRIACMGSMHEIGFFEGCIKEDTPCRPVTPYGIGKNALREVMTYLCQKNKKNYQWLRGYYIVGNSEHGSSIFSKITAAESEGKTEFPFTLGQNQYDFIDYDDFCEQVAAAVTQEKVNGVIDICSGFPEKLADRVEQFIRDHQYKIKLKYGAFPDRPYDSKAVWGNNEKIKSIMDSDYSEVE